MLEWRRRIEECYLENRFRTYFIRMFVTSLIQFMLQPWLRKSIFASLCNPCITLSEIPGLLLQVVSFDDSQRELILADSEYQIRGILSPACKDHIMENNPSPSQRVTSGLLIPKSYFFSKVFSVSDSGDCIIPVLC